ncbi:sulfatase [Leptospira sp. GIMC2001]|uniref:sulfatase n=1 Tax=Leptospira sp. GIMC2001 TaxID=1513297 RepID=UPI00234AB413|nr:sulfatase [Leptospira sp. GIMC2001]WCL49150.1 sulfatase [Leptospira sp. GIMC2001]
MIVKIFFILVISLFSSILFCKPITLKPDPQLIYASETISLLRPQSFVTSGFTGEKVGQDNRIKSDPWNNSAIPVYLEYSTKNLIENVDRNIFITPQSKIFYNFPFGLNHFIINSQESFPDGLEIYCNQSMVDLSARPLVVQCGVESAILEIYNPGSESISLSATWLNPIDQGFNELRESIEKVDVIFVVIDSLRHDVLGQYSVTPNLDSLRSDSISFDKHFVNAAWTRPSTSIFFTGRYASENFLNFWDYPVGSDETDNLYNSDLIPLPLLVGSKGYMTQMIGNNPFLSEHRKIGADYGFQSLHDYSRSGEDTIRITQESLSYLKNTKKLPIPRFLFLNYNDPHKPYTPPEKYRSQVIIPEKELKAIDGRKIDYLGEVAFVDAELGKILSELKSSGRWDQTMLIITSDHGEVMDPFHEISPFTGTNTLFGHGQSLFREDIHVPLIIKFPANSNYAKLHGLKVGKMTRSIDILPTILEELGIDSAHDLRGVAIQSMLAGRETSEREYYGETRATQAVEVGDWKLMKKSYRFHRLGFWQGNVGEEREFLYNTKQDPEEHNPYILKQSNSIPIDSEYSKLKKILNDTVPPNSYYTIRIHRPKGDKRSKIEFKVLLNAGIIRSYNQATKTTLQSVSKIPIVKGFNQFQFDLNENEIVEWNFHVYPDVSFPQFKINIDGIQASKYDWGVGTYDLNPGDCVDLECDNFFRAISGPPSLSKDFRIQIWRNGSGFQSPIIQENLGSEAMDILKKQGYVN